MMFLISLSVTNCCKPTTQTITEYKLIKPPDVLLTPCPDVKFDLKTNGDLVLELIELRTQYTLCSLKVHSLILFYSEESQIGE